MSCQKLLFAFALLFSVPPSLALAQSPVFATQTPTSGNSANTFFVFLPVANMGSGAATKMRLTSVTLNFLGQPVATLEQPAALPFVTGSGYLGSGAVRTLDLEFDNSKLVAGNRYLLTLRGAYEANGGTFGFALNRPLVYVKGFAATHQQVINVIEGKFQSRPRIDPQADDKTMLAFVSGLPQVSSSGLQVDPALVWMTFNDGGEDLVLLNNVILPARPVLRNVSSTAVGSGLKERAALQTALPSTSNLSTAAEGPVELPMSSQARVFDGLGDGFASAAPEAFNFLSKNGYKVLDPDATIGAFRQVNGDGVFYIATHGGFWNRKHTFLLWSTTPVDPNCDPSDPHFGQVPCPDPKLPDDVKNDLATDVTADDLYSDKLQDFMSTTHYAATNNFIAKYWGQFSDNAFVFFDACHSDGDDPAILSLRSELFAKNASVYAGWTSTVSSVFSRETAELVFDRLLGANEFCPEDGLPCHDGQAIPPVFAQRPFDYTQVEIDLQLHGLDTEGLESQLRFEPNPQGSSFGLLAPTISNMQVDETMGAGGQVTLNGTFGSDQGTVQVGGADANVVKWKANQIIVDLTLSGSGSAGDVQVKVRGHKSNVARLTDWRSNSFIFTYKENGSLQIQTTYNMHFRADVRKYRKVIHKEPDEPSGAIQSANDSTATFVGNGSGPGTSETFSLKGSGALVNVLTPSAVSDNIFGLGGLIGDSKNMTFDLAAGSSHGCTCTVCNVGGCHDNGMGVFGPSNAPNFSLLVPSFPFVLDETATIQKNAVDLTNLIPLCNSDITVATGQFRWSSVAPVDGTGPDPKSAR
jgi:hypothetical protein